jgi:hypothetical protein
MMNLHYIVKIELQIVELYVETLNPVIDVVIPVLHIHLYNFVRDITLLFILVSALTDSQKIIF